MPRDIQQFYEYIQHFDIGEPNPSTAELPLLGSPLKLWTLTATYLLFVLTVGPAFMKSRKPYDLKNVLIGYNLVQIVASFSIAFCGTALQFKFRPRNLGCMEGLPADDPYKYLEIFYFYAYYLSKFADFADTIFFVLRKRYQQVSFLHVYHHAIMPTSCYFYIRFYGTGGQWSSIIVLNSYVHVVMYSYYLLAALRPNRQNSPWWKKYITRLQLIQFSLVFVHNLYALLLSRNCGFPKFALYYGLIQSCIMTMMFGNFYWQAYIRRSRRNTDSKTSLKQS